MQRIYPLAILDLAVVNGGSFTGGPFKGVLHTTEGNHKPSYAANSHPHFTVNGNTVWQHHPIDIAARSLRNLTGGVQTNRDSAIQIEIIGFARNAANMDSVTKHSVRQLMRWVEQQHPIKRKYPQTYGSEAYGYNGAGRMALVEWDNYDGWCGHQHVPENTHWDPGHIDVEYLLEGENNMAWRKPGDDVDTDADATAVLNYQGSINPTTLDAATRMAMAEVVNILMVHDVRIRALENAPVDPHPEINVLAELSNQLSAIGF